MHSGNAPVISADAAIAMGDQSSPSKAKTTHRKRRARIRREKKSSVSDDAATTSPSNNTDTKAQRQVYILICTALVLFLISTFVLVGMIPDPSAHTTTDDAMAGAGVHNAAMTMDIPKQGLSASNDKINMDKTDDKRSSSTSHLRPRRDKVIYTKPDSLPASISLNTIAEDGKHNRVVADAHHMHKSSAEEYIKSKQIRLEDTVSKYKAHNDNQNQGSIVVVGDNSKPASTPQLESGYNKKSKPAQPEGQSMATNTDDHEGDDDGDDDEEEGAPSSDNDDEPQPRIIHILETRFMQNQPNLIQLAKARLLLLKTICLPTVIHQTAWGQFVWIIRTDPQLHSEIKQDLVTMLDEAGALVKKDNNSNKHGQEKEHALTYVIGSNDNYIVANSTTLSPGIIPFDIRGMLSHALSNPQTIFAGKLSSMQMLYNEISTPRINKDVIMWTRLDADDGLNIKYMRYIQSQAVRYFLPQLYPKDIAEEYVDTIEDEVAAAANAGEAESGDEKSGDEKQQGAEENDDKSEASNDEESAGEEGSENDDDEASGDEGAANDSQNRRLPDNDIVSNRKPEKPRTLEKAGDKRDFLEGDDDGEEEEENDDTEEEVREPPTMIQNNYTSPQWTYWCAGRNIDWFLTDPIHDRDHKNGTVYPVIHVNMCVTPGVTVALRGSFDPLHVPRLDHDKIASYLRLRGGGLCHRTGLAVYNELDSDDGVGEEVDDGSCFHMVTAGVSAVRSRTPTSAGMMGVHPDITQLGLMKQFPTLGRSMWRSTGRDFHISNKDLLETNAYFSEHVYDIAEENASGQCTAGHSCKVRSFVVVSTKRFCCAC